MKGIILILFEIGDRLLSSSRKSAFASGRLPFVPMTEPPTCAVPPFQLVSLWEYPPYAGLGLLSALIGIAFIRVLYGLEEVFNRFWRGPEWLRPGAGCVLLCEISRLG